VKTNEQVAIKVYKTKGKSKPGQEEVLRTKFKRQIEVLQELMAPLEVPADKSLWNEQLGVAGSQRLFMQLIDYSKDSSGQPGPDVSDGVMYVITEMAECSLKDYIRERRETRKMMSKETVRNIAKAVIQVTAGLHAKGLVHLDLKPENLMLFNGVLKLIDVDGCVKIGTKASITDSSLSFSPCYCAPEWANFLIEESDDPHIMVTPGLDVWSIGMTIPELVVCDAVLKPTYASFLRHGRSHREASFLFMDWLSSVKKPPIPKAVEKFDPELFSLLSEFLLVVDPAKRRTLAQSLDHPFLKHAHLSKSKTGPLTYAVVDPADEATARRRHDRKEVHDLTARYKGILWKLNQGGDPSKKEHWLRRDIWLAGNGSLCYHSLKEDKQLILIDGHHLATAEVSLFSGGAYDPAIEIKVAADQDAHEHEDLVFGCASQEDYEQWMRAFESARYMAVKTMNLGHSMAGELQRFRLGVKNRRLKVDQKDSGDHADHAVFKSKLWKLKADTDKAKEKNWFEREMWISPKGTLVYFSVKEDRELVYYTHCDLASASIQPIDHTDSSHRWGFHVVLPAKDGVEFTPTDFAAATEELRTQWMEALKKAAHV
jgi:serine/threonine protein kinase